MVYRLYFVVSFHISLEAGAVKICSLLPFGRNPCWACEDVCSVENNPVQHHAGNGLPANRNFSNWFPCSDHLGLGNIYVVSKWWKRGFQCKFWPAWIFLLGGMLSVPVTRLQLHILAANTSSLAGMFIKSRPVPRKGSMSVNRLLWVSEKSFCTHNSHVSCACCSLHLLCSRLNFFCRWHAYGDKLLSLPCVGLS